MMKTARALDCTQRSENIMMSQLQVGSHPTIGGDSTDEDAIGPLRA